MTAATVTRAPTKRPGNVTRRPVLTTGVCGVTLAVSLAALASPALMRLFVRNPQLQTGQWWRAVTPVLVQPSGWGQLVFNLLGIAAIGTALQLGGVLPSVVAGNASIIVMAHRAVRPATLTRASLAVVLVGGVAMTAVRDDHGAGILLGVTVACLVLARRRILAHPLAPGALTVLFGLAAPIAPQGVRPRGRQPRAWR